MEGSDLTRPLVCAEEAELGTKANEMSLSVRLELCLTGRQYPLLAVKAIIGWCRVL